MNRKKKAIKITFIILLSVFVLFSAASFIFIKISFDDLFGRTEMDEFSSFLRYKDIEQQYDRELLTFPSGKNQLQGYLYGTENTKGLVVQSHGLGGGAESYLAETLYFVDHGFQVFSFDNTGCYQSKGKNSIGLSQSVIDLDAALTFIEQEARFAELPVYLYGHSWGGYAVTAIFNYNHNIAASVSVAGFNEPMGMILDWATDMIGAFAYVEYPYIYLYQQILFGKNANLSAVNGINRTDTPILLIHGNQDTVVTYETVATIAFRNSITNPNVHYKVCEGEKQNNHNRLFMSLDAIAYADAKNAEWDALSEQYHNEIPDAEKEAYRANIDKLQMSELDATFMQDVITFFETYK